MKSLNSLTFGSACSDVGLPTMTPLRRATVVGGDPLAMLFSDSYVSWWLKATTRGAGKGRLNRIRRGSLSGAVTLSPSFRVQLNALEGRLGLIPKGVSRKIYRGGEAEVK